MDPVMTIVLVNGGTLLLAGAFSIWWMLWFRRSVKAIEKIADAAQRWERRAEPLAGAPPGGRP